MACFEGGVNFCCWISQAAVGSSQPAKKGRVTQQQTPTVGPSQQTPAAAERPASIALNSTPNSAPQPGAKAALAGADDGSPSARHASPGGTSLNRSVHQFLVDGRIHFLLVSQSAQSRDLKQDRERLTHSILPQCAALRLGVAGNGIQIVLKLAKFAVQRCSVVRSIVTSSAHGRHRRR